MDWVNDFETEMRRIRSEMDRVFDSFTRRSQIPHQAIESKKELLKFRDPVVHKAEDKDNYLVSIELPGAKTTDINLTALGNELTLIVKSKRSDEQNNKNSRTSIYTSHEFHKVLSLPPGTNAKDAKARYKNGMLKIELPKKTLNKPRRLKIDD